MTYTARPIEDGDLERIMVWRMSPEVSCFMNTDPVLTLEGQRRWLESIRQNPLVRYWLVEVDGQPAGVLNLADMDFAAKRSSWGYYIGELNLRSMKLAISLEASLYAYVFGELGFEELYGPVFRENWAVVRLHEMLGAEILEKEPREVVKNGVAHPLLHVRMLRSQWEKARQYYKYQPIVFS